MIVVAGSDVISAES